jgi:hypothetical protein
MAKGKGKTGLIVTIVALGLTLVIVGTIVLLQSLNKPVVSDQATPETTTPTETEAPAEDTPATTDGDETNTPDSTVDPSTLTSIAIEPMRLEVFYTKGTPGFEFAIKRTADRTQYIEFSSPKLVGTKCTDDDGVFATIIKNPTSTENESTISKKTTVGEDSYGLSLAEATCTGNPDLLKTYQSAFDDGFGSLKALED